MAVVAGTITIPAAFNGPLERGNGGYTCGVVAAALGGRAEVSLRSPVPLETALEVVPDPEGGEGAVRVLDGEVVVAAARPVDGVELEVPEGIGVEAAREASAASRAPAGGIFDHCFVCGRARADSFGVFAGPVAGRQLVASPWTPPEWAAGEDGAVRPELVWAVLDCPTYFAAYRDEEPALAFLVRESVEIEAPVPSGEELVAIAWPLGVEGRKRFAGAALLTAGGEVLARGEALLVEPSGRAG